MGDCRVNANHPSNQDHHVQNCDEEDLRLDLDDEEILDNFDQSRSALRFVARQSNEELHSACQTSLLFLRMVATAVVQRLVTKYYNQ